VGDVRRCVVADEIAQAVALARIDAAELRASQAPPRRYEVDTHDLLDVAARLELLCHLGAELATHAGDQHALHAPARFIRPPVVLTLLDPRPLNRPPPVAGAETG
jgi:hypothetical protein